MEATRIAGPSTHARLGIALGACIALCLADPWSPRAAETTPGSEPPGAEGSESPGGQAARKALDLWGDRLVIVELRLRKSEGEDPIRSRWMKDEWDDRRPLEVAGLAVDGRTVWSPELDLERRFIEQVDVRCGKDDAPRPATLLGVLLRAPGWVVRVQDPIPGMGPLEFAAAAGGTDGLLAVTAGALRGGRVLSASSIGGEQRRQGGSIWTLSRPGSLLIDKEMRAVGYSFSGLLGIQDAPDIWRGKDIQASPVLEFAAFDSSKDEIIQRAAPWLLTVRGFFRREEDDSESRRSLRFRYSRSSGMEGESRNDFLATGYAVGPRLVLVNYGLDQESAIRLEKVIVRAPGGERPARFLGAFRPFRAFLVQTEGEPLAQPLDLATEKVFAISQPLITVTVEHDTGRRRDLVDLNRVIDFGRAYKGTVEPSLERFPRPGTILLGAEGREFAGAVLEVHREVVDEDSPRAYRSRGMIDLRVLRPAEIRALVTAPEASFDRRLQPRSAEREKDLVWLGVDFQPINRELARTLSVEIPTRGGEIGLIILGVYPGSPAQKLGLVPEDILMSVREDGESEFAEFRARSDSAREEMYPDALGDDVPEEAAEEFLASTGAPWRSPRNVLNDKLTRIGEAQKVELTWLRKGKQMQGSLVLEKAPPDFENARKFKAEEIGLTVKDVTFEVRSHYRLMPDSPGVVVAKVERGGKAAIAKVMPYEILVSINGTVVRTTEEVRHIVEELVRGTGEKVLELKLERMGKSRLVRIRL